MCVSKCNKAKKKVAHQKRDSERMLFGSKKDKDISA